MNAVTTILHIKSTRDKHISRAGANITSPYKKED